MSPRRKTISAPRGFTLVEATLAIAITAMLLAGMGAALIASASAADLGRGASGQAINTMQALDQIRAELAVAKSVVTRTSTNIAFTIADRNGDGNDETIEYFWSGKPGSALYREMNGTGRSPMIAACDSVDFKFLVQPSPVMTMDTARTILSFSGDMSSGASCVTLNNKGVGVQSWLPATLSGGRLYAIRSVKFAISKGSGQSAPIRVRAIAMDAPQPSAGTLLGTATLMSGDIAQSSGYVFQTFTFATPALVDPAVGAWFVIDAPTAKGNAAWVAYTSGAADQPGSGSALTSSDCGASWTSEPDADFSIEITGSETTVTYPAEVMQ